MPSKDVADQFVETLAATGVKRIYGIVGDGFNRLTAANTVKITATSLHRPQVRSQSRSRTRVSDFIALMKPRVMLLAVFTAFVGMMIAPVSLDPLLGLLAMIAIAVGAGAAGVLNMWYDADIDAVMARTARRPIPCGRISRRKALAFGLFLSCGAVLALGMATNAAAAGLLAFTIFFYVVVYTLWLKRHTPQNIVIGGAAGALPPVIGWAAATGNIGLEPIILFLIIFMWTPPHFWALSLNRADEYRRAGVPMLPVVAGRAATTRQILIFSALLVPISMLPSALGVTGPLYAAIALGCGAVFLALAWQLRRSKENDRRGPRRLFLFSISYLFLLFAALLTDGRSGQWSPAISAPISRPVPTSAPAATSPRVVRTAHSFTLTTVDEV
jgi:protoheme IX farnesyltransferase